VKSHHNLEATTVRDLKNFNEII